MFLIGFGACVAGIFVTLVGLEVARHIHFLKYKDSGFVPGTEGWRLIASLIIVLFMLGAVGFLVLWSRSRAG